MKIIEKIIYDVPLNANDQVKQQIIFLDYLADLQLTINAFDELKKDKINNLVNLLLIYYPENWKLELLYKYLKPETIEQMIKEEDSFE
jgi:hypothetical protein